MRIREFEGFDRNHKMQGHAFASEPEAFRSSGDEGF